MECSLCRLIYYSHHDMVEKDVASSLSVMGLSGESFHWWGICAPTIHQIVGSFKLGSPRQEA